MRGRIVRMLKPWDAVSVENPAHPGTPDVNYIEGWVELKWMRRWPKIPEDNPVLIDHFTQQQRVWLLRRWKKGGNVWLLLQVRDEWLLFRGDVAAALVGRCSQSELYENALLVVQKLTKWKEKELCQLLLNYRTQNVSL